MHWKRLLFMSAVICSAPCLAFAQAVGNTAPNSTASTPQGNALEEVIVTAQKRGENINAVGMAITAVSGEQLVAKNVTNVSGLTRIEPSLQFSQSNNGTPVFTIRGVGYFEQSLAASPAVSVYQDEANYPFPVMSKGALLDTQRVEILKGPQGTLYGQNATGGLINFIANKPTSYFSAGVDETYSRFNDNLLGGFISGPLTQTLSARLAGSLEEGGAWQKSNTRNETLGNKDLRVGRIILDWKPASNFSASLNVNGWIDKSENQAGQLEGFRLQNPGALGQTFSPPYNSGAPNPYTDFVPAPIGSPTFNGYPPGIQKLLQQPISPHNDRAADWLAGTRPHNDEHFYQTSLRLDYSLSDSLNVTSITNYENFAERDQRDIGAVAVPQIGAVVDGSVRTFSQELRLRGHVDQSKLDWVLGVNFEQDNSYENDNINNFATTASYVGTFPSAFFQFNQFAAINGVHTTTSSVFANVEYRLTDQLDVHGGIRYTESDQKITSCAYVNDPAYSTLIDGISSYLSSVYGGAKPTPAVPGQCDTLGPAPNFQPGSLHTKLYQNNIPWRVGVDWTPFPGTLAYVTVSKGFKAGSSPALGATTVAQYVPVTQESVLAYELGVKSSLLDRTLQLNADVFYYDYRNKQVLGRTPDQLGLFGLVQTLINIPKSEEYGAELTAVWRPATGFTFNVAANYLKSRVDQNPAGAFDYGPYSTGPGDTLNLVGTPFPFTPEWSVQGGARYEREVGRNLRAYISADASYQTGTNGAFGYRQASADHAPPLLIKAYGLLNLAAGLESEDKHWRFEVWGKNVTNTYYWTSVYYEADTVVRDAGLPATYGLTLSYRY